MSSYTSPQLYWAISSSFNNNGFEEEDKDEEFDFESLSLHEMQKYLKIRFDEIKSGSHPKLDVIDFFKEYQLYFDLKIEDSFNIRL